MFFLEKLLSQQELLSLCKLNELQTRQLASLKKQTRKFFVSEKKDQVTIQTKLVGFIQAVAPSSIMRYVMLDPAIHLFCKQFIPDEYWNKFLALKKVNGYYFQARSDLDALTHVLGFLCFRESKDHDNNPESREKWHRLAMHYGFLRAHLKQTFKDESTLFNSAKNWSSWEEAIPLIKSTLSRSIMIAWLDWTPGFILLAYTYKFLG